MAGASSLATWPAVAELEIRCSTISASLPAATELRESPFAHPIGGLPPGAREAVSTRPGSRQRPGTAQKMRCGDFPAKDETKDNGRPKIGRGTRLNSSHLVISYAVFCLKKKKAIARSHHTPHPPSPP